MVEGEFLFTELTCVGFVPMFSAFKSHLSTARTHMLNLFLSVYVKEPFMFNGIGYMYCYKKNF